MDEQMYEDRASMPVYQSTDLDFDAARAAWERQQDQSAAYANYCREMAEDAPECMEPDEPVQLRQEGEW